jgi:hypothetical protein
MGTMKNLALREAVIDTALAATINMPLNYLLVVIAFSLQLSALETTLFLTAVFTVFAIIRKYYVRLHFERQKESSALLPTSGNPLNPNEK